MMRVLYILFFLCISGQSLVGQTRLGFLMTPGSSRVTMPFTFVNNLIVIPITINNQITLKFILDTGANNAILTERIFGDIIGLDYNRSISVAAPGEMESISAHVANNVGMRLPKGISGNYMSMLVLEQDYIELKKNLGEDVYGIIGYDVFSRFVVEINFDQLEVTFHDPNDFRPPRRYRAVDMQLEETKPYINAVVSQDGKSDTLKLMIDTGASHALLLDITESEVLGMPDTTLQTALGRGLGGDIHGSIGRFEEFTVGRYPLEDILVSIPHEGAYSNAIKRGSRHGTIGGHTLLHFNTIIDYRNGKLYLKRNGNFRSEFKFDMSGLRISYFENPKRFVITGVMERSPAAESGIMEGDELVNINGKTVENSTLSEITGLLRSRENRGIRATVKRDSVLRVFKFRLKKLI